MNVRFAALAPAKSRRDCGYSPLLSILCHGLCLLAAVSVGSPLPTTNQAVVLYLGSGRPCRCRGLCPANIPCLAIRTMRSRPPRKAVNARIGEELTGAVVHLESWISLFLHVCCSSNLCGGLLQMWAARASRHRCRACARLWLLVRPIPTNVSFYLRTKFTVLYKRSTQFCKHRADGFM